MGCSCVLNVNVRGFIRKIMRDRFSIFVFFFILNLSSNLFGLKYIGAPHWLDVITNVISISSMSAFAAWIETIILKAFKVMPNLKNVLIVLFSLLYLLLLSSEFFLLNEFGMIIGQDVIDVLSETNTRETSEFIDTYFNWHLILPVVFSIIILAFATFVSRRVASFHTIRFVLFAFLAYSLVLITKGTYSFIRYRSGEGLPQLTTITRGAYAYYIMKQQSSQFATILNACKQSEVFIPAGVKPFRHVVVVIGESSSYFHCSLYDYPKATFPRMSELKKEGSLIAYSDVVSPYDATHGVMKCIFSLDSNNFGTSPLFPALFHKAGYHTQMLDNQYFVSQGVNFLTNAELSNYLFDHRNEEYYGYDGNMLSDLLLPDTLTMSIIHLNGQHYTYSDRYPKDFEIYTANDYDTSSYSFEQRQTMASYDNSGRYCDYVLGQIIEHVKDDDALVVFFADHGEEVYDLRDYMGHGSALSSPDPKYLLKVPFFVWMSDRAREYRPALYDDLVSAQNIPSITTNFSHCILSICGIQSSAIKQDRSFLSSQYDIKRPRIVLNKIDYDKEFK